MRRLVMEGTVDENWCGGDMWDIGPKIDSESVAGKIEETFGYPAGDVSVILMVEGQPCLGTAGRLTVDTGWSGTDVTPGEPPYVKVGGVHVLGILGDLDGRTVALTVGEI